MNEDGLFSVDAVNLRRGATTPVVSALHAYLGRFGWLRVPGQERVVADHDVLPEVEPGRFDEGTEAAVTEFQRFYGLPVTGDLNPETVALMRRPRCGVPDKPPGRHAGPAEFAALGTKWQNLRPGYHLNSGTADLSNASVENALQFAYRSWCLVAQIAARRVSSGADIEVRFATGDHGDGANNAFDGPGNVLAHGFSPPSGTGSAIDGDLHFDDDETWTRDLPPTGIDLDTVALHEAGHTLGLDHSAVASAVMYPFYGGGRRTLTDDDVAGIRSLYGTRERNVFSDFDAAVEGEGPFHGKGYFFYGFRYLRYDFADDLPDAGYPLHIVPLWRDLPDGWGFPRGFDAALNGQDAFAGKLYLFRGDQYVRYNWAKDTTDPGYPLSIAAEWHGLPAEFTSGLDSAVTGKGPFAGKAYFFKGDQYVRYDWATDQTDPGYPKSIAAMWPGLPPDFTSGIQAAINGQGAFEGKLYLFKGGNYARYDWAADRADPGYPLPIEFNWF
ncbi:matrixin family metalloprotease [Kribbella sp. NPDC058693]|uniref:matrixin family metalloprotease n=1 Tax=Kribbella sp. NPDC058693 TaxID=3346602 RepID=UPI00364B202A